MPLFTKQRSIFQQGAQPQETVETITIGDVVDTNDPQQMGRVRAVCTQWGDSYATLVEDLPWAVYCSPFGGQTSVGTRGPGIQESEGGMAYGMWAIPKVGAQVLIMCVDGDPHHRIYLGCVYDQFTPHTMPHGRFMYDDHPELEKRGATPMPLGPYTSREKTVNPLHDNMKQAFGGQGEPNYEWRSRAADYTVSSINIEYLNHTYSKVADDSSVPFDDWSSTQGYQSSRMDPHAPSSLTNKNYDSMVYSITSPGFHAFSMDDRQENCRMRFRTSSGHQVIMDDTNERIYIATAKGNNWIEMDQDGNIDIFTTNKVNVRAKKDINFTSDASIRMHAATGIHMYSGDEVRIQAAKDVHVKTAQNLRVHAAQSIYAEAGQEYNAKSGSDMHLTSGGSSNVNSGGNLLCTAPQIHLNGPTAAPAPAASEQPAMWTNRVPDHEPWPRTMTKDDFSHAPEFTYRDPQVNKSERGRTIIRGMYWRR